MVDREVALQPLVLTGQPLEVPHAVERQPADRADRGEHLQIVDRERRGARRRAMKSASAAGSDPVSGAHIAGSSCVRMALRSVRARIASRLLTESALPVAVLAETTVSASSPSARATIAARSA